MNNQSLNNNLKADNSLKFEQAHEHFKSELFISFIKYFVIFSIPVLLISVMHSFSAGKSFISYLYIAVFALFSAVAFFSNKIKFKYLDIILYIILYLTALAVLFTFGFAGAGFVFLFFVLVMGFMFLNWITGFFFTVLNTVILIIFTDLYHQGVILSDINFNEFLSSPSAYLTNITAFISYSLLLTIFWRKISINRLSLVNKLESAVETEIFRRNRNERMMLKQAKFLAASELIENISLHWRQPLNVITMSLGELEDLIKDKRISDDDTDELIIIIKEQALELSNVIETFSDYFNPDIKKEKFLISDAINKGLKIIEAVISNNLVKLNINIKKDSKVYGFKNEFIQIILGIIMNSIEAINRTEPPQGVINISLDNGKNNSALLEISDNGGGILKEIMRDIFEPHTTTKHKYKGIGLGLYTAKLSVETNMKGHITAENISNGALIRIELPVSK